MTRDPGDVNRNWHLGGSRYDPTGAIRNWTFASAPGQWQDGLLAGFSQQAGSGQPALRSQSFTWAQDAAGNPYIGSASTQIDPGQSYQTTTTTTQTLDAHGNVTQMQIYDFGNASRPARTYNNTYLTDSNYTSRNIWNRLLGSSVTIGTQVTGIIGYSYDTTFPQDLPQVNGQPAPLRDHDANYPTSFNYRGNVSVQSTPAGATTFYRYLTGDVASGTVNLKFAVIYYSQAGQRVMNIAINGVTALMNFDIVAAAGAPNTAVKSCACPSCFSVYASSRCRQPVSKPTKIATDGADARVRGR